MGLSAKTVRSPKLYLRDSGLLHPSEAYFWATHSDAELDVLVFHQGKRYGLEVKLSESPEATRSMYSAVDTLQLAHLWVQYPGQQPYPIRDRITVWPLQRLVQR